MLAPDPCSAHVAASRVRVLAALVRGFGDVDLAEDAFQDAAARALAHWPKSGVPNDPAAWLIRTGRNAGIDVIRKRARNRCHHENADLTGGASGGEDEVIEAMDRSGFRDDVLRLMFMCCHPELSRSDQLALAMKVIAGFSVAKVARALLVSPKAMEQRITRAKKRAAATVASLEAPTLVERTRRLNAVTTMVYLLFNEGYSAGGGEVHIRAEMCEEAIHLARLLLSLFPAQSEVMGLLALCLLQHARARARITPDGALVPLSDQDRSLWDRAAIAEGQVLLEKALRRGKPGPYQVQAAIAAVHCRSRYAATTDWREIEALYAALEAMTPSPVVSLNRAVALSRAKGPEAALKTLGPLARPLKGYLHYHTTLAALLADTGAEAEARVAYETALSLGPTTAEAAHIRKKLAELSAD